MASNGTMTLEQPAPHRTALLDLLLLRVSLGGGPASVGAPLERPA